MKQHVKLELVELFEREIADQRPLLVGGKSFVRETARERERERVVRGGRGLYLNSLLQRGSTESLS